MDYNARYYSPVLGRFISPDTIVPEPTSSGGFNRYRYTRNNPLRYADPSGHCEENGDESCWSKYEQLKKICPECSHHRTDEGDIPLANLNETQLNNLIDGFHGVGSRGSASAQWTETAATYMSYGAVTLDGLAVLYSGMAAAAFDGVSLLLIGGASLGGPGSAASMAGVMLAVDFGLAGYTPAALPEIALGASSAGLTVGADFLTGKNHFTDEGIVLTQDSIVATRNAVGGALAPELNVDFAINSSQFAYDLERLTGRREAMSVEIKPSDFVSKDYFSNTKDLWKATYYECGWVGLCN